MVDNKVETPREVKVISVWFYISAVAFIASIPLSLIFTRQIFALFSSAQVGTLITNFFGTPFINGVLYPQSRIADAIATFAFGILNFFVGKGLWNGKKWAKVTAITISSLGIVLAIPSWLGAYYFGGGFLDPTFIEVWTPFFFFAIPAVIRGTMIIYLIFSQTAKEFFAN